MARRSYSWILWVVAIVVTVLVLLRLQGNPQDEADGNTEQPTFTVTEGPLTISVAESGTIRPREQIIIKSKLEGQTVVLSLAAEGAEVKEGDLLVELNSSGLLDRKVNQEIQVINAEASLTNVRENLEVVKSQAEADIEKADLELRFARQDLDQYKEGEYPKLEKEAKVKITLAKETLSNVNNSLEWSRKLFEEKYLSESELERDELSARKAELDLELAEGDLGLLQEYTKKRREAELESNLKQTRLALERARRKAAADIAQAEAQLKAREAEFGQQEDKLEKIVEQLAFTKIYAPMDGTVIYASSTKTSWRGNDEPLAEGQTIRERQELIHLPTTASYNVEIKIHESSLQKIAVDMPVQITIDALPGQVFTGRVASIAPLPDAQSVWMNPDLKVYNTTIEIDGNGEGLRNGMSCRAEIMVEQLASVSYVPIQAVMQVNGQATVYVAEGDDFSPRPIEVGLDNNRMMHVKNGLATGDTVLLTPPLAAGTAAITAVASPESVGKSESGAAGGRGGTRSGGGERGGTRSGGERKSGERGGTRPGGERKSDGAGGGERGSAAGGAPRSSGGWSDMTPEQREAMKKRYESMSPEEKEAMRKRRQGGGGQ